VMAVWIRICPVCGHMYWSTQWARPDSAGKLGTCFECGSGSELILARFSLGEFWLAARRDTPAATEGGPLGHTAREGSDEVEWRWLRRCGECTWLDPSRWWESEEDPFYETGWKCRECGHESFRTVMTSKQDLAALLRGITHPVAQGTV
jgi:hypothetical protein